MPHVCVGAEDSPGDACALQREKLRDRGARPAFKQILDAKAGRAAWGSSAGRGSARRGRAAGRVRGVVGCLGERVRPGASAGWSAVRASVCLPVVRTTVALLCRRRRRPLGPRHGVGRPAGPSAGWSAGFVRQGRTHLFLWRRWRATCDAAGERVSSGRPDSRLFRPGAGEDAWGKGTAVPSRGCGCGVREGSTKPWGEGGEVCHLSAWSPSGWTDSVGNRRHYIGPALSPPSHRVAAATGSGRLKI